MLSGDEGKKAVQFARSVVDSHVKTGADPSSVVGEMFEKKQGVFVTIHTYPNHDLRGCIGIPLPIMTLKDAIVESARSAIKDPRFSPLEENELNAVIIEVTILTKPEIIKVHQPQDYFSNIEIGKDGLIVEQGFYKGLLLPQVPVEQGWGKEEFLSQTCRKAGLLPNAWFEKNTKIYRFSGQIFTEIEPRGEIKEKNIDESNS